MFEINGDKWEIKIVPNSKMEELEKVEEGDFLQGLTRYRENVVYINEEAPNKKKTLIHELMHVYTYEYGLDPFRRKYDIEALCEICSASYDVIGDILKETSICR